MPHRTHPPRSTGSAGPRVCLALTLMLVVLTPLTARGDEVRVTPDVVYGHKFGLAMTMDVYTPARGASGAGVLFMVSGGWYSAWAEPETRLAAFAPLTDRGFTVFAVRHGSSPRFGIPEARADVTRAVRFIRRHGDRFGVDPERLGVYGISAGGHLALMLGTASDPGDPRAPDPVDRETSRVRAVAALVPPTDLRVMVWEAPESQPAYRRFPALDLPVDEAATHSPLLHASPDDPPTLLIVGERDDLVPSFHSRRMHAALQAHGVEARLVSYPESGHSLRPEDARDAARQLAAWFETHLQAD